MSFFLMCTGYYRSFITRYSALTSQMNAMNKDFEVQVIRGHEEGFQGVRWKKSSLLARFKHTQILIQWALSSHHRLVSSEHCWYTVRNSNGESEVCQIFAWIAQNESRNKTWNNRREGVKEVTGSWWSLEVSFTMDSRR